MQGRRAFMLSGAALIGSAGLSRTGKARAGSKLGDVLFDPDAPAIGNPRGDLTIVSFYDYQCSYCRKAHPMLVDVVRRDRGLRLVMKDWPLFGPVSLRASRLGLGSLALGRYGYVNSGLLAIRGRLTDDAVDRALRHAGVAPERAWASYLAQSGKWDQLIQRNHAQADSLGFFGTPSYVIGKVIAPGMIERDVLLAAIAQARRLGAPKG